MRNIPLEYLRHAIIVIEKQDNELVVAAGGSSFREEIREAPSLEGFKLPEYQGDEGKVDL